MHIPILGFVIFIVAFDTTGNKTAWTKLSTVLSFTKAQIYQKKIYKKRYSSDTGSNLTLYI